MPTVLNEGQIAAWILEQKAAIGKEGQMSLVVMCVEKPHASCWKLSAKAENIAITIPEGGNVIEEIRITPDSVVVVAGALNLPDEKHEFIWYQKPPSKKVSAGNSAHVISFLIID